MLSEIHEQPLVIARTVAEYVHNGQLREELFAPVKGWIGARREIVIAASGSSRHAGLAGEIMLEDLSGVAVDVEYASEYCYRSVNTLRNPAVILISQSGETADTLAALREATSRHHPTLAITNVAGSTMALEASLSLTTPAGLEKAIPATKSFTTQLVVLQMLALFLAQQRGQLALHDLRERLAQIQELPALLDEQLAAWERQVDGMADSYRGADTFLFLGRGIHYAIAREGALKLKESSYMHAEGYPAGELKHGPNALVGPNVPLVVIATVDQEDKDSRLRYGKTLQLLRDLREQGAILLGIANTGDGMVEALCSHTLFVSPTSEHLLPICEAVPLQLFAYFVAVKNGVDVDRPRNLVKAVVTE